MRRRLYEGVGLQRPARNAVTFEFLHLFYSKPLCDNDTIRRVAYFLFFVLNRRQRRKTQKLFSCLSLEPLYISAHFCVFCGFFINNELHEFHGCFLCLEPQKTQKDAKIIYDSCCCNLLFLRFSAFSAVSLQNETLGFYR